MLIVVNKAPLDATLESVVLVLQRLLRDNSNNRDNPKIKAIQRALKPLQKTLEK